MPDLHAVTGELTRSGLLAPVSEDGAPAGWQVHQWTASTVGDLFPELTTQAHSRAAAYWAWRVRTVEQDRAADATDLYEARHHLHAAEKIGAATYVSELLADLWDTWGQWDRVWRLCEETLAWLPEAGFEPARAGFDSPAGTVAQRQGDYTKAEPLYSRALAIARATGDRRLVGASLNNLGMLARDRGNYAEAELRYRESIAISEELGDRASLAANSHQLGVLARARGDMSRPNAASSSPWPSTRSSVTEPAWLPATTSSASSPRPAVTMSRPNAASSSPWPSTRSS